MSHNQPIQRKQRVIIIDHHAARPLDNEHDMDEISTIGYFGYEVKHFGVHGEVHHTSNAQKRRQQGDTYSHHKYGLPIGQGGHPGENWLVLWMNITKATTATPTNSSPILNALLLSNLCFSRMNVCSPSFFLS